MARVRASLDHPELELPEVQKLWQTGGLFSDHYLKARIRSNSWWPTDEETRPLWEFCKELYEKRYVTCARNNEAFTRQELIDKILERFGFAWTDNLGLPETQQDLEPDYILFGNESEKEAVIEKGAAQRYRSATSLLEAKKVNHPLSQISTRQQRYPHQQIRDYLNEAQVISWGILTNGNEWRLYCRDAKPSQFFAIDFGQAIKSLENFKFFVALFSPAAFARDAQGKCRLDYVRENALAAQSELEEDLRKRVFALVEILANGFAERAENDVAEADLAPLYNASLIFLYRLLFILYAEGRQLLPVEPKSRKYYKQLSLARLVTPLKNFSEYDSRSRTRLYEDIRELCHLINGTDEKKNTEFSVPRYNGGLFDPNRHPLLEKWRVSDAALSEVLRGLMFNPQPNRNEPMLPTETVDFGDLRVQQLGSIYEGLMEHHFHREKNTLKLVADKAERRQTGTYYTPDYIVKCIVEQTIGTLLREIEQNEPVREARAAGKKDNSFAREVLKLNILDPAMGSGHFLVDATTYLAEEIAAHPTTQSLSDNSKDEDEIAHWRRRVVESCIYGIDLNPLAVELAKLSLWLITIAADQPLDFLDHHLCCGNSLIGARLDDLGHVPELKKKKEGFKFTWKLTDNLRAALQKAVQTVRQIEDRTSQSIDDVKTKETIWLDSVRPALRPFRSVANLWTACFFGNDLPQRDYEALLELLDIDPAKIRPWKTGEEFQEIVLSAVEKGTLELGGREFDKNQLKNLCAFLIRAEKTSRERRFFHWELEFPEVFFDDRGLPRESAGFDAVVGNPPYDADLDEQEKTFINLLVNLSNNGRLDTASLFVEQLLRFTAQRHGVSYLLPQRLIGRQRDFGPFQRFIYDLGGMQEVIYLGTVKEFASNDEFVVMTFVNGYKGDFTVAYNIPKEHFPHIESFKKVIKRDLWGPPDYAFNIYLNEFDQDTLEKINADSFKLGEIAESKDGIVVFIRDKLISETQKDGRYRKFLGISGRYLLDRFVFDWEPTYVCYDIEEAKKYIKDPSELRKVQLRDEKIFARPEKLLTRQDSTSLRGTIDREQFFHSNSIHSTYLKCETPYSLKYILCLINSPILTYFYQTLNLKGQDLHPQILVTNIPKLPIRRIEFTTSPPRRIAQCEKAKQLFEDCLVASAAQDALRFVEAELHAGRADVVHDLLAFLADRIMVMNQEKRETAKQFLTDLQDFHNIDTRALNPKTKLDQFWKLEAVDVFAHLRKNARRLEEQKVRLSEMDEGKIRSRLVKAKEILIPLETQITLTDKLIDQIVYRLYGLSDAQIKIVEGAAK